MKSRALAAGAAAFLVASATAVAALPSISSPYRSRHAVVAGQEEVSLDRTALAALRRAGREPFRVADFPTAPGVRSDVILRRFEIADPDARIRITGENGDAFLPLPDVAHFEGHVPGDDDTVVYVAALPDTLVSWVRSPSGTTYVGPDESRRRIVVRDSASPAAARPAESPWMCMSDALPEPPASPPEGAPATTSTPDIVGFQSGKLILETDQELLAKFAGDTAAMSAYLLTLAAQVDLIYERDLSFHFTVTEIHVWTMTDPWNGPTTLDQLYQLGDWYHGHRSLGAFPRSTVYLASGQPVTGGIAWRPALCVADFSTGTGHWGGAYAVGQMFGDWPAQVWDLLASAHELGHNSGSAHTHCYVPPIDMCYSGELDCYSGPTSVPPELGTIMSYCHLLPPGDSNVILKFHTRCITEQLLPYIQAAACTTAKTTFPDVPTSNPFFHYVETIYRLGITGGCSGGNYCPGNPVTRAQMAVFLLKAKYGSAHVPPPCTGVFPDVTCTPGSGFGDWIEELASLGITTGCGSGLYCPNNTVTRKQMAPFLIKTLYGSSHVPAPCTGVFADVVCTPGTGFDDFIEELYTLGVTGGCLTGPLRYCPDNPNTRAQMAVFLVKTFNLVW